MRRHAQSALYGARTLLAALPALVARHPRLMLALFGPARAEGLAGLARSYGVDARVRFFGELGHEQALAVIAASDLFVRPTLADGDALSLREALALGRRVVATEVGVRPQGAQLVRAGDALDLVRGIEEALERPAPTGSAASGAPEILAAYARSLRSKAA